MSDKDEGPEELAKLLQWPEVKRVITVRFAMGVVSIEFDKPVVPEMPMVLSVEDAYRLAIKLLDASFGAQDAALDPTKFTERLKTAAHTALDETLRRREEEARDDDEDV